MENCSVRVNGAEVAPEGPRKTVLNISITQESSLACLLKAVAATRRPNPAPKVSSAGRPPAKASCNGEQRALGAAQILLGLMCLGLGAPLCLANYWGYNYRLMWNGVPFWMGSVFVLSGIFSVVGERRGGGWVNLATFLHLASVVAVAMALTSGLADLPSLTERPSYIDELCTVRTRDDDFQVPTQWPGYEEIHEAQQVENCKDRLWQLQLASNSTHLLLLLLSLAALGVAVFGMGYGLRLLWRSCQRACEGYAAAGDPEAPPSCEDPEAEKRAA